MRTSVRATAAAALLLTACGGDQLLGENGCYGEKTHCESGATTYDVAGINVIGGDATYPPMKRVPREGVDAGASGGLGNLATLAGAAFPVETSRVVRPTWVFDCPRPLGCDFVQIEPAKAGVWAATIAGGDYRVQRFDSDGTAGESMRLGTHPRGSAGPYLFSVDEQMQPVLGYWSKPAQNASIFQLAKGAAEFRETVLADLPLEDPGPRFFLSAPDGSFRAQAIAANRAGVYAFDGSGALLWKQGNLRDLPVTDYQAEDAVNMLVPDRAVVLQSGNTALLVPKLRLPNDPNNWEEEPAAVEGVTLLDANGNMLWDAVLSAQTEAHRLIRGGDESLVLAHLTFQGDLSIYRIGEDATLRNQWAGLKQGYQSVAPRALAVDAEGNVYVALYTGERGAQVPSVCRLPVDPSESVECLGIDIPFGGVDHPFDSIEDLASPEPNAVVIAINRADSEPQPMSLARIDF